MHRPEGGGGESPPTNHTLYIYIYIYIQESCFTKKDKFESNLTGVPYLEFVLCISPIQVHTYTHSFLL